MNWCPECIKSASGSVVEAVFQLNRELAGIVVVRPAERVGVILQVAAIAYVEGRS